jgi:hypothetical protein
MEINTLKSLNKIKNTIACSKIALGIVAAEINLTVSTPDAKVQMMHIKLSTLTDWAVSEGIPS